MKKVKPSIYNIEYSRREPRIKQGISHIDNAERNRKIILNIIREAAEPNRQRIAENSFLSISTTKRLIEQLLSEELIVEGKTDPNPTKRGPKAKHLRLNGRYGYSIGLNIQPDRIDATKLNFAGEVLSEESIAVRGTDPEIIVPDLLQIVHRMNVIDKNIGRFLGIGVGIEGLVDAREGMVYYCPNLPGWNNVNLKKEIQKKIQADIVIDDAVRFMALSEKRYGIAKDFDNYLYIYIGSGVGSGIVLNNRFYRGKHGISGEFGHMTIRHDGPICNCGNRGCLEALVSIDAILRMTHEALDNNIYSSLSAFDKDGLTFEHIASAALNGDKLAGMILHDTAENIGIGSADLMNVFDPGVIIFNGELFHKYGKILEEVTQIVRLRGIAAISGRTEFHIGESNKWSGSRGAATAIIENYIESDILNI